MVPATPSTGMEPWLIASFPDPRRGPAVGGTPLAPVAPRQSRAGQSSTAERCTTTRPPHHANEHHITRPPDVHVTACLLKHRLSVVSGRSEPQRGAGRPTPAKDCLRDPQSEYLQPPTNLTTEQIVRYLRKLVATFLRNVARAQPIKYWLFDVLGWLEPSLEPKPASMGRGMARAIPRATLSVFIRCYPFLIRRFDM